MIAALQILVDALSLGSLYALAALGDRTCVWRSASRQFCLGRPHYVMRRGLVELAGAGSELADGARRQQRIPGSGTRKRILRDDSGAANSSGCT